MYLNGVGEVTISAIQMGDIRYHPALPESQKLIVINPVNKDDQVISFEEIPLKVRDDPPFELNASSTSGLPIEFSVISGPASVNPSGIVVLEGIEGNVTITAAQGGSAYFKPAIPVTRTFEVSVKQRPDILFPESANDGVLHPLPYGHRAITLQGVRSTTSDFPYIITSMDESIARIHQGNQIIALREGMYPCNLMCRKAKTMLLQKLKLRYFQLFDQRKMHGWHIEKMMSVIIVFWIVFHHD